VNDKAENDDKAVPKFDWVTERSACTLAKVFKEIELQVEEDVKTRNGLRPPNSPYEFSVAETIGEFTVMLKAKDVERSVTFSLSEHGILVREDRGTPMLEVTLAFTDEGACSLEVNGKRREPWQVRRMALEELFFRG
jgi:hypothetical protein